MSEDLVYTLSEGDDASWKPAAASSGRAGVWKTYGVDSLNASPFSNGVEVGNGILVARWWQEADVPVAFSTPPFLVYIYVALKFGSTTEVTGAIQFEGPFGMGDEHQFEIDAFLTQASDDNPDVFQSYWPTQALASFPDGDGRAIPGSAITPTDASFFVSNSDPVGDATVWGIGTPGDWVEGSMLSIQRMYLGAFYGD